MFLRKRFTIIFLTACLLTGFVSCKKPWDEHNQTGDTSIANNLMQAISATPNLSKFAELLVKSGYDKIISLSKTYTVWAPTDQALQTLDPAIVNDPVRLNLFVGNHISDLSYTAGGADQRLKMLNGKYNTFSANRFDAANITTANVYANNGIIHIIDQFIPRLDNIWELINSTTAAPFMKSLLLSLNRSVFDPAKATQTGINPLTGQPVYDTASGLVNRNGFLDSAQNVSDEANQYTMFLLTDAAYTAEINKLKPWFKTSSVDSTNRLAGYWLVKDLAFSGLITINKDTVLTSKDGVKVPIVKSAITSTIKTSNGIVYVINALNFNLADKFPPIIIEGESASYLKNPADFALNRTANTYYRFKTNPVTGLNFSDIYLLSYNAAAFWIRYPVAGVNSMRYNVFWVAVNDVQTTPLWQQRLAIDSVKNVNLPYVTVPYKNYSEVSLGQITVNNYRRVELFLVGPAAAANNNTNSMVLDYIKLVPAF